MAETSDQDAGCYVYGVARDLDAAAVSGLAGVAGAPVRLVVREQLSALVSPVDLAEFGADGLRRNLEDLDWLEATARAHHAVLAAVGSHTPVVPLRLATVYHDEERVHAALVDRAAAFDAALRRVAGRSEWGLKAFLGPAGSGAPGFGDSGSGDTGSTPGTPAESAAERPGTAYLLRRRTERRGAEHRRQFAADRADAVHSALAAVADAARRYPPQSSGLSGESRDMVLNAAYLVHGADRAGLDQALREAGTDGLVVEWTGPWVPYSFAELDPAESDPAESDPAEPEARW